MTRIELAPEGGRFRLHTRIAAFDNVPELLTQFRAFADLLDDGDTPVAAASPPWPAAGPRPSSSPPPRSSPTLIAELRRPGRADPQPAVAPDEDNMLMVCNDGRLAALDLRLVGRDQDPDDRQARRRRRPGRRAVGRATATAAYLDAAGQPSPTRRAAGRVLRQGHPGGDGFNVYDELRDLLAARRARPGPDPVHPRRQHRPGQGPAVRRLPLTARSTCSSAPPRRWASAPTSKHRLVALHHLDVPWRPADIEQREGRILRQGNQNPVVHVVRYVTDGSFDPYMWQTVERKARFIAQIIAAGSTPPTPSAPSRTSTPKSSCPTPRSKPSPPATR